MITVAPELLTLNSHRICWWLKHHPSFYCGKFWTLQKTGTLGAEQSTGITLSVPDMMEPNPPEVEGVWFIDPDKLETNIMILKMKYVIRWSVPEQFKTKHNEEGNWKTTRAFPLWGEVEVSLTVLFPLLSLINSECHQYIWEHSLTGL